MDIDNIESIVKTKIQSAFDLTHIYEIFGVLISAVRDQQSEIERLKAISFNHDQQLQSVQANVNIIYNNAKNNSDVKLEVYEKTQKVESNDIINSSRKGSAKEAILTLLEKPQIRSISRPPSFRENISPLEKNIIPSVDTKILSRPASAKILSPTITLPAKQIQKNVNDEINATTQESERVADNNQSSNVAIAAIAPSSSLVSAPAGIPDAAVLVEKQKYIYKQSSSIMRTPNDEIEWKKKKFVIFKKMYQYIRFLLRQGMNSKQLLEAIEDPTKLRLVTLEKRFEEICEIVWVNRRTLHALPQKLRKLVPPDLKTHLTRVMKAVNEVEGIIKERDKYLQEQFAELKRDRVSGLESIERLAATVGDMQNAQRNINAPTPTRFIELNEAGQIPQHIIDMIVAQLKADGKMLEPVPGVTASVSASASASAPRPQHRAKEKTLIVSPHRITNDSMETRKVTDVPKPDVHTSNGSPSTTESGNAGQHSNTALSQEVIVDLILIHTNQFVKKADLSAMLDTNVQITLLDKSTSGVDGGTVPSSPNSRSKHTATTESAVISISNVQTSQTKIPGVDMSFSDKFNLLMLQMLQQVILGPVEFGVKKSMEVADKNMQSYCASALYENGKTLKQRADSADEMVRGLYNRLTKVEISNMDTKDALETLDIKIKDSLENVLQANAKQNLLNVNDNGKPWRSDLIKVVENVRNYSDQQKSANEMLIKDLETLRKEVRNRVSEGRVEEMLHSIEDNITKSLGQNLDGMTMSLSKITKAVKGKADLQTIEKLIIERMMEAEDSLKISTDNDATGPAGTFRCISCGSTSPTQGAGMKFLDKGLEIPFAHNSSSLTLNVSDKSVDKEQLLAVINRSAGLKPIGLHYQPMRPRSNYQQNAKNKVENSEPLYRRAKLANQYRESPKVSQSASNLNSLSSSAYVLDDPGNIASIASIPRSQSQSGIARNNKQSLPIGISSSSGVLGYLSSRPNTPTVALPSV